MNKGKRFPAEPLTLDDVALLRKACSKRSTSGIRASALFAVLYYTGIRVAELCALMPKDVDVEARTLRILHGKGDRSYVALLPDPAVEALQPWLERRARLGLNGRHPLFSTIRGRKLTPGYIRGLCKRIAKRAGVEKRVAPHQFRHGYARALVAHGVPVDAISTLLGHSNIVTTSRYLHALAPTEAIAIALARMQPATP